MQEVITTAFGIDSSCQPVVSLLQVMSAFDVDDPFTSQIHQAQQQQQQQQQKAASAPLKKPPKWLRRPCGATFAVSLKDQAYSVQVI